MKYAILGAGAIGTALVRRFVANGIEVSLANSKGPESLAGLVGEGKLQRNDQQQFVRTGNLRRRAHA